MDDSPWRSFSAEELEKQYLPSEWVQRIRPEDVLEDHINTLGQASRLSRKLVPYESVVYGTGEEQKIDLFGAKTLPKDAPILVYFHGGYWQYLSLELSAHLAKGFYEKGVIVASIGYDPCPKVTFEELIDQNKQALIKVLKIAHERGSRGVYLTGHSAGGHLTVLLLATDWSRDYQVDGSIIKGGAPIAGIFDLRPFSQISENNNVRLTMESAWKYSPWRMIDDLIRLNKSKKIKVLVGEHDSPEFQRQSKDLTNVLADGGIDTSFHLMGALDHFEVTENLQDTSYKGSKILLEMMNIT